MSREWIRRYVVLLFLHWAGAAWAQTATDCSSTALGVNLEDCPVCSVSATDDVIQLEYVPYLWEIPGVDVNTNEPGVWTMSVKTFHVAGLSSPECSQPTVPSPILRWNKGQTVRLNITNRFDEHVPPGERGRMEYFTNIHTHGLHISPDEDDPTVDIPAGTSHYYEFHVPRNHGGGTHWYHPHIHTLSELVVGAGAAGLLLIEDSFDGTELPRDILQLEERNLVIQKLYPAKLEELRDGFEGNFDGIHGDFPRAGIRDSLFSLEQPPGSDFGIFQPKRFFTFVNGYVRPRVNLVAREWMRLRMLYIAGEDPDEIIADGRFYVDGGDCTVKLIAKDGVYLRISRNLDFSSQRIILHPASRTDVLVKCESSARLMMETTTQLGVVMETTTVMDIVVDQSVEVLEEEDFLLQPCLPKYLPDMTDPRVEVSRIPPPGVDVNTIRGRVDGPFSDPYDYMDKWFEDNRVFLIEVTPFQLNDEPFRGYGSTDFNLTVMRLGEVYEWRMTHGLHPLHVHVNHFQLQTDVIDGTGYHRRGDYVDTISTYCPDAGCKQIETEDDPRDEIERVTFRVFPDTYIGRVLVHCHNYDHADSGAFGEAWVVENPDSLLGRSDEAWSDTCNTELSRQTLAPTTSPTRSPTTSAPTLAPTTGSPTSGAPTVSPNVLIRTSITPLNGDVRAVSDGVKLSAGVDQVEEVGYTATWGEVNGRLRAESGDFVVSEDSLSVYILPFATEDGESYTFQFTAVQPGAQSSSQLTFSMNAAPSGGTLTASVNAAVAAVDEVVFRATFASPDANLPLRYTFYLVLNETSPTGEAMALSELQDENVLRTTLPLLSGDRISLVTVSARATDSLGAKSPLVLPAEVLVVSAPVSFEGPNALPNVNELLTRVVNADTLRERLSLIYTILSVVNSGLVNDPGLGLKHMQFLPVVERELNSELADSVRMLDGAGDMYLLVILEISKSNNLEPAFFDRLVKVLYIVLRSCLSELEAAVDTRALASRLSDTWMNTATDALANVAAKGIPKLSGEDYCLFALNLDVTTDLLLRLAQFDSIPGQFTRRNGDAGMLLTSRRYSLQSPQLNVRLTSKAGHVLEMRASILATETELTDVVISLTLFNSDVHLLDRENECTLRDVQMSEFENLNLMRRRLQATSRMQRVVSGVTRVYALGAELHQEVDLALAQAMTLGFPTPHGERINELLCGVWDSNVSMYVENGCSRPEESQEEGLVLCRCGVSGDIALFKKVQGPQGSGRAEGLVAGVMFASTVAVLLAFALLYNKDRADAEQVQLAAHLVILQQRLAKRKQCSAKARELRALRRYVSRWKVLGLHSEDAGYVSGSSGSEASTTLSLTEFLWERHSVIGLTAAFNPLVSRTMRLAVLLIVVLSLLGVVAAAAEFQPITGVTQVTLVLACPLVILIVLPLAHLVVGIIVREQRKSFHRVAFLAAKAGRSELLDRDEKLLLRRHDEYYVSKQKLKGLYRQHQKFRSWPDNLYDNIRLYVCCASSDLMAERVYGGFAHLTERYLVSKRRLMEAEDAFDLRPVTGTLIVVVFVVIGYITAMSALAFHFVGTNADSLSVVGRYYLTVFLALVVALMLYEPILLIALYLLQVPYLDFKPVDSLRSFSRRSVKTISTKSRDSTDTRLLIPEEEQVVISVRGSGSSAERKKSKRGKKDFVQAAVYAEESEDEVYGGGSSEDDVRGGSSEDEGEEAESEEQDEEGGSDSGEEAARRERRKEKKRSREKSSRKKSHKKKKKSRTRSRSRSRSKDEDHIKLRKKKSKTKSKSKSKKKKKKSRSRSRSRSRRHGSSESSSDSG